MKGAFLELDVLRGLLSFEWYAWIARSAHMIQCINRCKATLDQMAVDRDYVRMTNTMKKHMRFEDDFIRSFSRDVVAQTTALRHYSEFVACMVEWGSKL